MIIITYHQINCNSLYKELFKNNLKTDRIFLDFEIFFKKGIRNARYR